MKILIGPNEIAGYYSNLSKGFDQLEVSYNFFTFHNHPFRYGGRDKKALVLRIASRINSYRLRPNMIKAIRLVLAIPEHLARVSWCIWAILKYDVFIFSFGESLFPRSNFDLLILRLLRKKVISVLAHGSEARPPFIDGGLRDFAGQLSIKIQKIVIDSEKKRQKVARMEKYSTLVIGAPFSSSYFLENPMINFFCVGIPCNWPNARETIKKSENSVQKASNMPSVRILHSPSHPAAKGSPIIIRAIENLKNKGFNIDFVLIHGQPHSAVLREIELCDFVVDQLYSDTPMAGFATEAAWYGKPAVVGGYGFNNLKKFVPPEQWPPSKICHPSDIEQAIEDMIVDIEGRKHLGTKAQRFVMNQWSAVKVAERYLRLINNDIPKEWWLNPSDVIYLEGAGQTEGQTKENIREMVNQFGVKSLQLGHRPDLEEAFLNFAEVERPS
jgi:hypothetical protein